MRIRDYDSSQRWRRESSSRDSKSFWSWMSWTLSVVLGRLALLVFLVACALIVVTKSPTLKQKLFSVLPESVVRALSEREKEEPQRENQNQKIIAEVKKTLAHSKGPSISGSVPASRITVGMTKDEVLRIQGQPTRISGNVWHYGESTVHFAGDRVVAWQNSPAVR